MQQILLVIHILVAISLIALILLQHGKGADVGAAFGSGASGSVFGARGSASFLSRVTAGLAAMFFLLSLTLAYLSTRAIDRSSVVERVQPVEQSQPTLPSPEGVPDIPEDVPAPMRAPSDVPALPPE